MGIEKKPLMDTARFDALKATLDVHRPLPQEVVRNLREDLTLRWTYNSNAIEGNTLTLKETKVVLEGVTVGGKSLVEHLEATNHAHAIEYVFELVRENSPLTQRVIKDVHSLVLKGICEQAGAYRVTNVIISGAEHVPPEHMFLAERMAAFEAWCANTAPELHAVERAARVHVEFVKIHPFTDGNGRTARLLMNLELMKGGFPPVVVRNKERLAYYEALDCAHVREDYALFFELTHELVVRAFEPYWFVLGLNKGTSA